ncbi:uncharacterized protein LOC118201732 [Stegodyphus dumicola]|uniref:uncharacterized protein LOC118201732 n=1 Tax=Stegodyphus dumicola TaxID=202533 RepID=UPI0015A842CA|nr:uncharacterized protein LOC118201732 [Stegodyphus dumicola]
MRKDCSSNISGRNHVYSSVEPNFLSKQRFLTEYQKEYLDFFGKDLTPIDKRHIGAGISSKGPPDGQPEPYQIGDGIIPPFRGESVSKQAHQPQPPIRQLPAYKPPEDKPPMLLGPEMMEVESYSSWSHRPFPLELARRTRPEIPNWVLNMKKPLRYESRFDLTSSYQADYCGPKTKTRKICLDSENGGKVGAGGDIESNIQTKGKALTHSFGDCVQLGDRMWNHIHSLLFRTTTGSTYLPPSVFGGSSCHPSKSRFERICPANTLATKTCKIHQNQKL